MKIIIEEHKKISYRETKEESEYKDAQYKSMEKIFKRRNNLIICENEELRQMQL